MQRQLIEFLYDTRYKLQSDLNDVYEARDTPTTPEEVDLKQAINQATIKLLSAQINIISNALDLAWGSPDLPF